MNKSFASFNLFLLLIAIMFISFKHLSSVHFQSVMLYDFNNGQISVNMNSVETRIDENFPNLTMTALPIKFLKARYYIDIDSMEIAKKLLYQSIKDNPYIFASESTLAKIYYNEKNIDSALYYSKKAFNGIPNNNSHRSIYFTTLKFLNDSINLDEAFNKIKNYDNPSHWINYILVRNDINNKYDQRLINLLDEMRIKFPEVDTLRLNSIKKYIELGGERFTLAYVVSEDAMEKFKNSDFEESARLYESAIVLNNEEYLFYENAAMVYDNLNNYSKAINYYNKVIYEFKTSDGKSEFLKGLLLIKTNNKIEGCNYLKIAAQKNYKDERANLYAANILNALCN